MDNRAWLSGASSTAPTAPASPSEGYPTAGNISTATPATNPGAYWFHQIGEELRAIIAAAGETPSQSTLNQVLTAIQGSHSTLAPLAVGAFAAATGTVNQSWYEKRLSGIHRQCAVIQVLDNLGGTAVSWTFPNASLFGTGVLTVRCTNLSAMASGSTSASQAGEISVISTSTTGITFYGKNTNVSGTQFWALIEVEGY